MEQRKAPVPPGIAFAVGIVAISFSAIFIKWSNAPASVLGMYRLWFTVILMAPFLRRHLPELAALRRRDWLYVCASGACLALHFLFWIESLKYTSVASSLILLSLQPIFVMIGAYFLFREKTQPKAIVSMVVAIVGTVVIAWGDDSVSQRAVTGDIMSILGTLAVSGYMLAGQNLRRRMSSVPYSVCVFTVSAIILTLFNIGRGVPLFAYPSREWGIFWLLAVVPTIFGHALFNWLLKYVSATAISMSVLGEPVGAIILAYFLLGEGITAGQIVGGFMALCGVWLFLRASARSAKPTPAAVPAGTNS